MPKVKKSYSIEKIVAEWLDHKTKETDVPASRIVEKSIVKCHEKEIEAFVEVRGGDKK